MRRVVTLPVADQLLCLRGLSPERLRFEVEYGLERGTSTNSFFIPGPEEATLIHPPGESFREPFLEALKRHCPPDHPVAVVVGHVNPNRVGLLRHYGHGLSPIAAAGLQRWCQAVARALDAPPPAKGKPPRQRT